MPTIYPTEQATAKMPYKIIDVEWLIDRLWKIDQSPKDLAVVISQTGVRSQGIQNEGTRWREMKEERQKKTNETEWEWDANGTEAGTKR